MALQRSGFTLLEVMVVVMLIGMLAVLSIPYGIKSRDRAMLHRCVENRRQIIAAKEQAAFEFGLGPDTEPESEPIKPYFRTLSLPVCPSTYQAYIIGTMTDPPTCETPGHGVN